MKDIVGVGNRILYNCLLEVSQSSLITDNKQLEDNKIRMRKTVLLFCLVALCVSDCVHDEFVKNTTKHYYDDLTDRRLLQAANIGPLRIFADYSQIDNADGLRAVIVKRIMNITSNYFYKMMKVQRISKLYYPADKPRTCNVLTVPEKYVTLGLDADIGIVVGTQNNANVVYLAKSTPCAFLASTKRPIWGMILFNLNQVRNDQEGFQEQVYIALHELTHILAFSSILYDSYPLGNPLVGDPFSDNLLSSPKINAEVEAHFGCKGKGLELEDQDGTLVSSHWEYHNVGSEFMIATNKKQSYVSRFTLALFDSTGWYFEVDYSLAEPSTWGKGKGCDFMNIDQCNFDEFCTGTGFDCDWDNTGIGRCGVNSLAGSCSTINYFGNTICIDENYEAKNLNAKLFASERGGYSARCIESDYRKTGLSANILNNRCYISVCNSQATVIYILINQFIFFCSKPGQIIPALPGFDGTLTCPEDFSRMCQQKKTCYNQCSKNGMCINGRCLCYNSLDLFYYCDNAPPTTSLDHSEQLKLPTGGRTLFQVKVNQKKSLRSYDMDGECSTGFIFDPISQQCESCADLLGCESCNKNGCIECEDGGKPKNGSCLTY